MNDENAAYRDEQRRVIALCRDVAKGFLNKVSVPSRSEIRKLLQQAKMLGLEEEPWVRVVATDVFNSSS